MGDTISAAGGVEESIVARVRCGWKKFRELLPLLTPKVFSLHLAGNIFQQCVRNVVLYGGETWAVKIEDCNVDVKTADELRDLLGLVSITTAYRGRLRLFGHIKRTDILKEWTNTVG